MGRGTARRLLWGLGVVGAVLVPSAAAGAPAPRTSTIDGAIQADGTPGVLPDGWSVAHPAMGVYRIVARTQVASFDVPRWDAVADVTIEPMGGAAEEIRFVDHGAGVDTDFSFTVVVDR